MNNINLIGRISKFYPQAINTVKENYLDFNLAVKDDFNPNKPDFFIVRTFKNNLDFAQNYLQVGDLISIIGRVKTYYNNVSDKNYFTIIAIKLTGLESKRCKELRNKKLTTE